jgi:hypothetical protein
MRPHYPQTDFLGKARRDAQCWGRCPPGYRRQNDGMGLVGNIAYDASRSTARTHFMPQHFSAGRLCLPRWLAAVALAGVLLAIGSIPFANGQDDRCKDPVRHLNWTKLPIDNDLRMPLLIGLKPYVVRDYLNKLRKLGFDVRTLRGRPAPNADLVFCIDSQDPAPNQPLRRGQKIVLRFYDREWYAW